MLNKVKKSAVAEKAFNLLVEDHVIVPSKVTKTIAYYADHILKVENFRIVADSNDIYLIFYDINWKEMKIKPKDDILQQVLDSHGFNYNVYFGSEKTQK